MDVFTVGFSDMLVFLRRSTSNFDALWYVGAVNLVVGTELIW